MSLISAKVGDISGTGRAAPKGAAAVRGFRDNPSGALNRERTIRLFRIVHREGPRQVRHTTVHACPVLSSSRPTCSKIAFSEQVGGGSGMSWVTAGPLPVSPADFRGKESTT